MQILKTRFQIFNKLFLVLSLTSILFFSIAPASYALEETAGGGVNCSTVVDEEAMKNDPTSQLAKIVCPVGAVFNIAVLGSGAAFVAMIMYGTLKFTLSQGDTKAIEGGKQTITWGILGFLAVISAWAILNIILNIYGIPNPASGLEEAITLIAKWAKGE